MPTNGSYRLKPLREAYLNENKQVKWRKILYMRQPFPDEYSGGDEFLKGLRKNANAIYYGFPDAVCGASCIILHADTIVLYLLIFEIFSCANAFPTIFTLFLMSISLVSYVSYMIIRPRFVLNVVDHMQTLVTVLAWSYAITPIIRTLSDTISSDTIYAMALTLFTLSFIFHDYGIKVQIVSMVLSTNLCLAAAVCLVSRIKSNKIAFYLLTLSIFFFFYWPYMRNDLCSMHRNASLVLVSILSFPAFFLLYRFSFSAFFAYSFLHVFIILICPWIFNRMQLLKCNISGPWDEAHIKSSDLRN